MCKNSRLNVLELANCVVKPVGLVSWNALKRLYFYGVMLSDAAMEGIVSGCPVLEILHVCRYVFKGLKVRSRSLRELVLSGYVHHFDEDDCNAYLEISAPNLRTLTISSCFYTWDVRLEDVTSLVRADLSFYLDIDDDAADVEEYDKYLDLLQELMEKLHHVEELKLATWCIQVCSSSQIAPFFPGLHGHIDLIAKGALQFRLIQMQSLFFLSIINMVFEKQKSRQLEPCRRLLLQMF